MVSLGNENHQHRANLFGSDPAAMGLTPSLNADLDEVMCDHVALIDHMTLAVRPYICTTWLILLHIVLVVSLAAAVFLVPIYLPDHCSSNDVWCIDSQSLIIYVCAIFWFFTAFASRYYKIQHRTSRAQGYLEFYRQTRTIRQIPLILVSGANSFLLILVALLHRYCGNTQVTTPEPKYCGRIGSWQIKSSTYIQILISVETLILLFVLITYLVRTCKFNRNPVRPDIHQEEAVSSYVLSNTQSIDVGFRTDGCVDQVLEKQADMIGYLKQHTAYLSQQLLKLQEQLSARHVPKEE